ncbi:oligosaccharide flippase family protein [Candidatus Bathyarchaeota archaeon]|nr:oligosaccharide flippase family protein [Candidatus Bathyarchaeota archaeon]
MPMNESMDTKDDKKIDMVSDNHDDLFSRTFLSGIGILMARGISVLIELLKTFFFAFLLSPEDFGIVGGALLIINTINLFSESQIEAALIQKKGDIKSYLDSAWSFKIVKSIVVASSLSLLSPLIASGFQESRMVLVIIILSIMAIFRDMTNIGIVHYSKDLRYKKIFIYRTLIPLFSFFLVILLSLIIQNYWIMVFSYGAVYISEFILSFLLHPYRPRFKLDREKLKEILGYSKWIYLSSLFTFFNVELDDFLVGVFFGIEMLGFYQLAYRLSCLPATQITFVVSEITFSSYSIVQEHPEKLRKGFTKTFQIVCFIAIPFNFFILFFCRDLIIIFLQPDWEPLISLVQILSMWGLIRAINGNRGALTNAIGKPSIDAKIKGISTIILYSLLIPLGYLFGVHGIAMSILITSIIASIIGFRILLKLIRCKVKELVPFLFIPLLNSLITIFILSFLKTFFLQETSMINLILLIAISAIMYISLCVITERLSKFEFISLIKELLSTILPKKGNDGSLDI